MTVQPRGGGAIQQLALTRRKVKFNPVTSRLCGGTPRTGYLRVSTFSKQTAEGVGAALRALKVPSFTVPCSVCTAADLVYNSVCRLYQYRAPIFKPTWSVHARGLVEFYTTARTADAWKEGCSAGLILLACWTLQDQGADRYILDVRNNGGGSFPAGIQVLLLAEAPSLYHPPGSLACPEQPLSCCLIDAAHSTLLQAGDMSQS